MFLYTNIFCFTTDCKIAVVRVAGRDGSRNFPAVGAGPPRTAAWNGWLDQLVGTDMQAPSYSTEAGQKVGHWSTVLDIGKIYAKTR